MIHRLKHLASGVVMGLAGLFPGVSAGTVALLIGIHGRLITAMANVDHRFPKHVAGAIRGDSESKLALNRVDLPFIGVIVTGMLLTIFTGAKAVTWLQLTHPGPVMATFFGLITFGALIPWRRIDNPGWREAVWIVPGALVAVALALAPEGSFGSGLPLFFLGGLIAMPMMILPGVSGSAMLVTIGLYAETVAAAGNFDVAVLLTFLAGGVLGLLLSAKGLKWLLDHRTGPTMAFLTGLLAGSIIRVWPWRTETGFAAGLPALPTHDLGWLIWTALAAGGVLYLERFSRKQRDSAQASDNEPYQ